MKNIPQIQFNYPDIPMHNDDIFKLPPNTIYGNLTLKHADISIRLKKINKDLKKVYHNYYGNNIGISGALPLDSVFEPLEVEQIVYGIRVVTDQLICLLYILNYNKIKGDFPDKIKIDSIGKYLSSKIKEEDKEYLTVFADFTSFLTVLNNISNAYKHSFLNSDTMSLRGKTELCCFALGLKANKVSNTPEYYAVRLVEVIEEFNKMYSELNKELDFFVSY